MNLEVVTAYLERLLRQITGNTDVRVPMSGRASFTLGGFPYYVRINDSGEQLTAEVYSVALERIPSNEDPSVLSTINDINNRLIFTRAFLEDRQVVVANRIPFAGLNKVILEETINDVVWASAYFGPQLQEVYGGNHFALAPSGTPEPGHVSGGYL